MVSAFDRSALVPLLVLRHHQWPLESRALLSLKGAAVAAGQWHIHHLHPNSPPPSSAKMTGRWPFNKMSDSRASSLTAKKNQPPKKERKRSYINAAMAQEVRDVSQREERATPPVPGHPTAGPAGEPDIEVTGSAGVRNASKAPLRPPWRRRL
jgi:hypothetical protein